MEQQYGPHKGQQTGAEEGQGEPTPAEELTLHEERMQLEIEDREQSAWVRKHVIEEQVHEDVPRDIEEAEVERTAPGPEDSGEVEILPDGAISIPILEEELVVSKRTVVRERIIVRKRIRTEEEHIQTTLRREQAEIEGADVGFQGDFQSDQRAAS